MRAILLSAFAVTALAGQAAAADLPTRKEAPAPYIAPPMFTWTGFYGGLNAGYAFGNNSVNTTSTNTFAFPAAGGPNLAAAITGLSNFGARPNNNGFIGGGQIGYNWQFSSAWVGGIETDLDGLGSGKGSAGAVTSMVVPGFPANTVNSERLGHPSSRLSRHIACAVGLPLDAELSCFRNGWPCLWRRQREHLHHPNAFRAECPSAADMGKCGLYPQYAGRLGARWRIRMDVCAELERQGRRYLL